VNRTSFFLSATAVLIAGLAGCQAIANLSTRSYDPLPSVGCALPSTGDGRVRLANLANVTGNADFCIRTSGTSDWGRPVFRDGGNDKLCLGTASQQGGLPYGLVTVPFAVPVGKIDVKAIPAGQTCSAAATSEKDGITIADSVTGTAPPTTLVRWGGGSTAEGLAAFGEYVKPTVAGKQTSNVRIINALSGGRSIEVGQAAASYLPTTVTTVTVPVPIAPGAAAAQATASSTYFAVSANGYMNFPDLQLQLGAFYSSDAQANAIATYYTPQTALGTFYVIGDPSDTQNKHVVRALYCDESLGGYQATDDAGVSALPSYIPAGDDSLFAQCTLTSLPVLSVDLVNVALYGANAPFEVARAAAIPAALAARTSDIMCIVEADDISSRNAIIAAAAGQYPYSYDIVTDNSTPPTNPADVKPAPSNPPCGSAVVPSSIVSNWFNCVNTNCGVDQDDAGLVLNGTSTCLESSCLNPLGKLYTSPLTSASTAQQFANDACFDCSVFYFTSEPLALAQNCVNNAEQGYAFLGQSPELILSHYPLVNTKSYILPATGFRRAVLKAQVQLQDQTIDFFCAQLSSAFIDSTVPYTGNYGSDSTPPENNGWENEQDLQAEETVAWIKSETAADGLPAIIVGDLHAGLGGAGLTDAGAGADDAGLTAVSTEVINAFTSADAGIALVPAIPANYIEGCDYCPAPQNPYNSGDPQIELMHGFLYDFPAGATQSETLWGTSNTAVQLQPVPGEQLPPGGTGPLFEYYPHNYQILRPTPAAGSQPVADAGQ
jgi:hypothetical protein